MGLPRATAFRFGQDHFKAVFNFYLNSRQDQKRVRRNPQERVAILFLGLRHDARNAPSCFKSSLETIKPQDDTNIHVLNSCVDFFSVHRLLAFARSINTLLHAACCPLIKAVENSVILVKR